MFHLQSKSFKNNQLIPKKYSCDGENISPPLYWTKSPNNTKSFVLIMDAPDAPHGTWNHWIMYNIPKESRELPEGIKTSDLPIPTQLASNSWLHKSYGGPCPPCGEEHRYYFKLYALKNFIEPDQNVSSKINIERVIDKLLLGKAVLIGKYARLVESISKKEITKNILGDN